MDKMVRYIVYDEHYGEQEPVQVAFGDENEFHDVQNTFFQMVRRYANRVFRLIRRDIFIKETTLMHTETGEVVQCAEQEPRIIQFYSCPDEDFDCADWADYPYNYGLSVREQAISASRYNSGTPYRTGWYENGVFVTYAAYIDGDEFIK
jgi:hypothetical protein